MSGIEISRTVPTPLKPSCTAWRITLVGLLMVCVALVGVAGCAKRGKPEPENSDPHVKLAHSGLVSSLVFSPDGKHLAVGGTEFQGKRALGWRGEIKIWETAKFSEVWSHPQKDWVNSLAFSPDGSLLAVGCECCDQRANPDDPQTKESPGAVNIYDAKTGKLQTRLKHRHGVYVVAFSPNGKFLAAGGGRWRNGYPPEGTKSDAEAILWDTKTWTKGATLRELKWRTTTLAFSKDGKTLAVGDGQEQWGDGRGNEPRGSVKLYVPGDEDPQKNLLVQEGRVQHLGFSPAAGGLVVLTENGRFAYWDHKTGKEKDANVAGFGSATIPFCLDPEGKTIGVGGNILGRPRYSQCYVRDIKTGTNLFWQVIDKRVGIYSLAISPDMRLFASGWSEDEHGGEVLIWCSPKR